MTNAGDDFALCIYLTDQLQYPLVAAQPVGCKAAGDDQSVERTSLRCLPLERGSIQPFFLVNAC